MSKRAIITGITGQDGSYLAELLLEKGYEVVGMIRRSSAPNFWRIQHLLDRITIKPADLLDQLSLIRLVDEVRPHEFYNLAAMSFVPASWDQPMLTGEFNAQGVTRVLEAIRQVDPSIRDLSGLVERDVRQGARDAADRVDAVLPAQPVRRVEGLRATTSRSTIARATTCSPVSGMLFNHESPRRGLEFVTRKVTDGVARIKLGLADTLSLGNLDAQRDWGFAGDYVEAMWMMLQQERRRRLRDRHRHQSLGARAGRNRVRPRRPRLAASTSSSIPKLMRPAEVEHLIGDNTKARAPSAGSRPWISPGSSR